MRYRPSVAPVEPVPDAVDRQAWDAGFPLFVSGLALLLVAGLRIYTGVGFGGLQREGAFTTLGIFANEHDNLQYLAWCRQAFEGRWLFEDRFTLEPHAAVVFHPIFQLVGWVSQRGRAGGIGLAKGHGWWPGQSSFSCR